MIRFSIVTITYNAEKVLQRTLDSVRSQTYEGVEHLIVDGASKDQTLAIVEQYKQQSDVSDNGHKVIIQSEPDHGIYDAMNKGLTQASGDYIVFLNAGDSLPTAYTLEEIVHHCRLNEFPASPSPAAPRNTHVAVVPSRYARLPSGFLCPHRHCQEHTVRHPLPFLCRCRLVHPRHEGKRTHGAFAMQYQDGCG